MDALARIETAMDKAVSRAEGPGCPPKLATAMRYSVFPGGARLRPRLALAVAWGCGDDRPELSDAAAAAIEFLHCASLVHDDLPCFDDADMRRGKPSVQKAFGEPIAVLAGDALIILAFETLAMAGGRAPLRMAGLIRLIGRSVGAPTGIVAGQAWEGESAIDLAAYHQSKTGSLFAAATMAGALAAGADPEGWRQLGLDLGEAYQVADDIRDVAADPAAIGKPVGQDAHFGRPSAARELGLAGAIARLDGLVERAVAAVPPCRRAQELRAIIRMEARKFLPRELAQFAA
jgi:geranylgeranyl diphosphate synthase type II